MNQGPDPGLDRDASEPLPSDAGARGQEAATEAQAQSEQSGEPASDETTTVELRVEAFEEPVPPADLTEPEAEPASVAGDAEPPGTRGRAITLAANLFRKLFGPFVWVLPDRWDVREILVNDYLLHPGTLIWYALLPLMAVGFLTAGVSTWVRQTEPFVVGVLWLFTLACMAQYLILNVSYRQRESLFPFLLVFALYGLWAVRTRVFRWAYGGYGLALSVVAAAHLVVRTLTP